MVKNWRRRNHLASMIISEYAKVTEMTVFIVNQRVKNEHTSNLLSKVFALSIVILKTFLNTTGLHYPANRNIRNIFIRKQRTLGRGNSFPVFKVIMHCIQTHSLCDLRCIILAVRLSSGIGSTTGSTLIKIDSLVLHVSPCLGKHAVCGQLRRRGKYLFALPSTRVCNQCQHL